MDATTLDDFGSSAVTSSAKVVSIGSDGTADDGLSRRRSTATATTAGNKLLQLRPQYNSITLGNRQRRQHDVLPSKYDHGSKAKYQTMKLVACVVAAFAAVSMAIIHYLFINGTSVLSRQSCAVGAQKPSSQSIILTASHLRQGSDGELRLRIIEHNLRLLFSAKDEYKPLKSITIFSLDGTQEEGVHGMVDEWRQGSVGGMVDDVMFVENDAVLVDASKWMAALYKILPDIERTNARVMLMNDSFLLHRNVPELLDDKCGGVCGLAWTAPPNDPERHIQSYLRSVSACEAHNYMAFYEKSRGSVHNVNELIQLFEMNLDWTSSTTGSVSAEYEYAGAHPDADEAQRALISRGYPAIKLKKFFETSDPWLSQDDGARPRLPPSFSAVAYRKMNHDLNHLSEDDLENHFVEWGKDEGRIYSATRKLVVKRWMEEELRKMGEACESTMGILEDYLDALNGSIAAIARSSATE